MYIFHILTIYIIYPTSDDCQHHFIIKVTYINIHVAYECINKGYILYSFFKTNLLSCFPRENNSTATEATESLQQQLQDHYNSSYRIPTEAVTESLQQQLQGHYSSSYRITTAAATERV